MTHRRLVLYILLNAFVTVLVSGAFLYFYNRANSRTDNGTVDTIITLSSDSGNAEIISVTGTGTLASEAVLIQNNNTLTLPLTGWTLKGDQGMTYTFPQLTLYPGGKVQIHSGSGIDTAADLYWQSSEAVWKSGDLVSLYDTQNNARAFYRVP
jgi:hypothetical protein